jgi:hypothetical protein
MFSQASENFNLNMTINEELDFPTLTGNSNQHHDCFAAITLKRVMNLMGFQLREEIQELFEAVHKLFCLVFELKCITSSITPELTRREELRAASKFSIKDKLIPVGLNELLDLL